MIRCRARAFALLPITSQTSAPKSDPELKKLYVLIGIWTFEGEYKPGPLGGGSKVKDVWDACMILGGLFLHDIFDVFDSQ